LAVKINQKSNHRFGLDLRVGGALKIALRRFPRKASFIVCCGSLKTWCRIQAVQGLAITSSYASPAITPSYGLDLRVEGSVAAVSRRARMKGP
jgi:hypothetical protein